MWENFSASNPIHQLKSRECTRVEKEIKSSLGEVMVVCGRIKRRGVQRSMREVIQLGSVSEEREYCPVA